MTYDRIQNRRGTASQWTSVNPTLLSGELGVETDTGKLKVGDGSTAWASRNYAGGSTNASDLVSGTLNDARLSSNVLKATAQTLTDNDKTQVGDNIGWYGTMLDLPAPCSAAVNPTTGNLNGTYWYAVSFVNAIGETGNIEAGVSVSPVNQQVDLTSIPLGPSGTTARKIYRGIGTGYNLRLVTTLNDNTTTTFTDNVSNATVAANTRMPRINTTGGVGYLNGSRHAAITNLATIIGVGAAPDNAGLSNTIYGKNAGNKNHWGYWLTLLGEEAGEDNEDGFEMVCVGYRSGRRNRNGWYGTNLGVSAGQENVSGANRTNVGYASGRDGTVSSDTNVGAYAGLRLTTGGRNTTLGDTAAAYNNNGTPLTLASHGLYLGADARAGANDADHEIVIGTDARGGGSYTTTIGSPNHVFSYIQGAAIVSGRAWDPVSTLMRLQPRGETLARGKGVGVIINAQPTDSNALFPVGALYGVFEGGTYDSTRLTLRACDADGNLVDRLSVSNAGVLLFANGTMKLVSTGAADSESTGFRSLRVPN